MIKVDDQGNDDDDSEGNDDDDGNAGDAVSGDHGGGSRKPQRSVPGHNFRNFP